MANIKISQLTAATSASGTQEFEVNDSNTSKKVTGAQIKAFVKDGLAVSDVTDLTATAAELNTLDGITATAAELNILDGVTASTTELNYVDGVTSAIQTQLDAKAPTNNPSFTGTVALPQVLVGDSVITGVDADGTFSSGTYTPTPSGGNMKSITNSGAFTIAAPTTGGDYTLVIQVTNSATAGAITLSGFTKSVGGPFTTTNAHKFYLYITKLNGSTLVNVAPLQ